jgi:Family of unknown function (DUF6178)
MSKVIPLSRFRADIGKSGSQRLREIISSKDVMETVRALDPLEIFSLVLDVGESDAMDIIALADSEQVKRVVDLGLGRGDVPDFSALDRLMSAAAAHGHGTSSQLFLKLDEELQTLYLARRVLVYDARDSDDLPDAPDGVERLLTPDRTFIIEVLQEKRESKDESLPPSANDVPVEHVFSSLPLIADLYSTDWRHADTMMRDVRHTLVTELEEQTMRLRDARLEEMGFPPHAEAMKVFSRRQSAQLEKRDELTSTRTNLPAIYAEPFLDESFFARALSALGEDALTAQLESELVYLINADSVVERRNSGEADEVRAAASDVRDWISLGLEVASQGELEAAASLIKAHPLRAFMSLGLEQSYKLGDWARRADAQGLFKLPGIKRRVLSTEDAAFIAALLDRIPRFVDETKTRAFGARRDLVAAQKRLELVSRSLLAVRAITETVVDFSAALERAAPDAEAVNAEQILRSALVRRAIGASLKDTLIVSPEDLRAFRAHTNEDILKGAPESVRAPLEAAWTSLVTDIAALGDTPDPRFINLITRAET